MRDPLDELKNLGGDLDARPLPPAEVRRRGSRMRRRRILGQAVGAAAAVAVVVSGGAFATGSLSDATPPPPGPASQRPTPTQEPTPEDVDWLTTVPDDLGQALFDSLPDPVEGEDTYTFAGTKTPWKALPCGEVDEDASSTLRETWFPGLDDKRTDQRFNLIEPPAETHARQLVVYRDGETATSVVEAIRQQTESCGPLESIPGAAELRWSVTPFDFGGDEGLLLAGGEFALESDARGVGRQLIGVVRQGNAVLTVTLSDESSSALDDLTEPDAARVVELTTRFAGQMCVFAADGCGEAPAPEQPDETGTAQLPYMIGPDQLDDATTAKGWEVVADGFGPPMVCAEDSTEALAGDRTSTMHFAVIRRGSVRAMATATVLDFGTTAYASQPGPEAFSTAADWLETCDEPVDREHRIFSAGEAYGELHNSQSAAGAGGLRLWRTVMSTAPERCVECDAAWNNHQGVALARGGRLVLLQVSLPGDLQLSVDETTSPMPKLLDVAAELAANGGPHPDDAREKSELLALGPGALGPIGLGMSLEDLEAGDLVRGTPESCDGFDAKALEGRIDGYASQAWGVEAIFARPPVRTPEGIGFDSTRADVEEVYGELTPSSVRQGWLAPVPGSSGRSYSFDWDVDGKMTEMALLLDDGDCFG